jgi:hypothetical protein
LGGIQQGSNVDPIKLRTKIKRAGLPTYIAEEVNGEWRMVKKPATALWPLPSLAGEVGMGTDIFQIRPGKKIEDSDVSARLTGTVIGSCG